MEIEGYTDYKIEEAERTIKDAKRNIYVCILLSFLMFTVYIFIPSGLLALGALFILGLGGFNFIISHDAKSDLRFYELRYYLQSNPNVILPRKHKKIDSEEDKDS